jgi:geranylgeranyl pyrophosphate synthase
MTGLAPALNMGNWLYFVSGSLIENLECGQLIKGQLHRTLNRIMLRCHQGQSLDVSIKITEVTRSEVSALVDTSTRLKLGVLIGFALQLGSIFMGQSRILSEKLYHFGEQLGLALQMYDDLSGILKESRWDKGDEDLIHGRLTWVWAWMANDLEFSDEGYERLVNHVRQLGQPHASSEERDDLFDLWRRECKAHIAHRGEEIETVIDHACDSLTDSLEHPELSLLIKEKIQRLKRSYL